MCPGGGRCARGAALVADNAEELARVFAAPIADYVGRR